ncbi:Protein CBG27542 [Caenorhabditis briggsae]|uniref:Protein CBG27542 n=1 Tax=Caenorhabditis briggsae TaxID=6238 RepID=B6IKK3_CAEBR|nr:Protein CBG27542 [Caenorhabditis briggsae]CAS00433.1 Protein CBG27542 [Caenorhabditis briggsae]
MCALEEHQELYGIPARQAEQQEENNNQMFQQDHDQERENRRGPDPPEPDSGVLVSNENEGSDQCLELVCMPMIKNAMQAAGLKYNKRTGKYINSILGAYEEGFEYMEGVKSAEIYIHPRQLAPIIEELNALYECHWFIDQLRANMKANRWGSYFVATNTEHIICY